MSKNCRKNVEKMSKNCRKNVEKLSKNCRKIVEKMSNKCREKNCIPIKAVRGTVANKGIFGNQKGLASCHREGGPFPLQGHWFPLRGTSNISCDKRIFAWPRSVAYLPHSSCGDRCFLPIGPNKSHVRVQYFGHNHPFPSSNALKKTQKSRHILRHYVTLFCTISFENMLLLMAT